MKLKKKDLLEIIDSNGELIGKNDIPTSGGDLESQANNTTDYNAKIGTQPFRYDMLGRFGFSLMPFMEGKENDSQIELLNDLGELVHEKYIKDLEYYYRNPNKLKSDFRKIVDNKFHSEECQKADAEWAKKIIKLMEPHFEKAFKEPIDEVNSITESKVEEDKLVNKKSEDEISKKSEDEEIKDKKLQKVAGLINKLDKKDIDKLINLLERKNE
jgi:hypothetical protein